MDIVLITKQLLTNIANTIRLLTNSNEALTLAQMPSAIEAIPTYKKIYSTTKEVSATGTSFSTLLTADLGAEAYTKNKILYIKIRDTAGPRAGYYYGGDYWYSNQEAGAGEGANKTTGASHYYRCTAAGVVTGGCPTASSSYGICPYTLTPAGKLTFRVRYSSQYTLTINGTFSIECFLLPWPSENDIPWAAT